MPVGDQIGVDLHALAPGGDAVGRQIDGANPGRVVFVPLGAPGERARVRVVREKARLAWGEWQAAENPSPARVVPPCPLFGTCGGCQWQHVNLIQQREAKRDIVERALGIAIPPLREAGPAFGYRDRVRLAVGAAAEGGAANHDRPVGFHGRRSHELVDVPACLLLAPAVARWLPAIRRWARTFPTGTIIDVQAGHEGVAVARDGQGQALLSPDLSPMASSLPPSWALQAADHPVRVNVAEPNSPPLSIPPGAFAQVSAEANDVLVTAVKEALGPLAGRVLELYAGSGNFTRHLVGTGVDVVATDGDPAAVQRGKMNVPRARWTALADAGGMGLIDTVLVDPPRAGLTAPWFDLAASARQRIVYVSCDPQTLGRDARLLAGRGFHLAGAVALDLMPQTYHVEVVATFLRTESR